MAYCARSLCAATPPEAKPCKLSFGANAAPSLCQFKLRRCASHMADAKHASENGLIGLDLIESPYRGARK